MLVSNPVGVGTRRQLTSNREVTASVRRTAWPTGGVVCASRGRGDLTDVGFLDRLAALCGSREEQDRFLDVRRQAVNHAEHAGALSRQTDVVADIERRPRYEMLPRQAGEQKPAFAIDCEQAHGPQRGRENHERPIGQSNGIAQGFAYLSPPESLRDGGGYWRGAASRE